MYLSTLGKFLVPGEMMAQNQPYYGEKCTLLKQVCKELMVEEKTTGEFLQKLSWLFATAADHISKQLCIKPIFIHFLSLPLFLSPFPPPFIPPSLPLMQ